MTGSSCFDFCYQKLATPANREFLHDLHEIGDQIRRIKDINSARGLAFLIDNSLGRQCRRHSSSSSSSSSHHSHHRSSHHSSRHSSHHSSSSSSIESFEDNLDNTNGTALIAYELQLMAILSVMAGAALTFPVQFSSNAAKSCDSLQCADCCNNFGAIDAGRFYNPMINQTSCVEDTIEPACRLAYKNVISTCTPATKTPNDTIAIAIINSDTHSHVHKEGNYGDYSPCSNYFHNRYAIGLHQANHDDLARFASRPGYHNYITDGSRARDVTNQLYTCIRSSCCATVPTVAAPTACQQATGHDGEVVGAAGLPPNY